LSFELLPVVFQLQMSLTKQYCFPWQFSGENLDMNEAAAEWQT